MKNIRIYDFEDSFTFNIATCFFLQGVNPIVLSFKELEKDLKNKDFSQDMFVLGPGPGSPKIYDYTYDLLKTRILSGYKFLGICLGHQIILNSLGFEIRRSNNPIHGFTEKLKLDEYWKEKLDLKSSTIEVQRYNSLEVFENSKLESHIKCLKKNDVVYASSLKKTISYQFHPESIGTLDSNIFFNSFIRL